MAMFKFFWKRIMRRDPGCAREPAPLWRCDPPGHRQLADMSLRELADLPPDVLRDLCVTPLSRCKVALSAARRRN